MTIMSSPEHLQQHHHDTSSITRTPATSPRHRCHHQNTGNITAITTASPEHQQRRRRM
jgi:hypothetical protein